MDHAITALPVDPFAIAAACDILVEPKPPTQDGVSGMLVRVGDRFGILYATHIANPGFQRFSVSHELGHYFLAGHPEQLLSQGAHASHANFASADPWEIEADMFAASLLMPRNLFTAALRDFDDGLAAVLGLAERCGTSLTATAIAVTRHSRSAVAVIQSFDGKVEFCSISGAMKTEPLGWLKRGTPVPTTTLTHEFGRTTDNIAAGRQGEADTRLNEWFQQARGHVVREEVVGLGGFGRTLTFLHCPSLSLASDGYDVEDDYETEESLQDRWTPRFR